MKKNVLIFFSTLTILVSFYVLIIFKFNYNTIDYLLKDLKRSQVGILSESYITVFTAYYKFPRSKHKHNQYDNWTTTFMTSVTGPIVIFTDDYSLPRFKYLSQKLNLSVTFYVTKDIWSLVRMIEKWRNKNYIESYKKSQRDIDPNKWLHNPNLYAIWNSKHFMAKIVLEQNSYKSDFFIYSDIGAWRKKIIDNWPNVNFVKNLSFYLNNSGLYGQIYQETIEGGFFAGTKSALFKLIDVYYKVHDEWLDKGLFIGNDQSLMNQIAFREYPRLVKRLRTWGHGCIKSYDRWFFYQYFLAHYPNCSFNLQNCILD